MECTQGTFDGGPKLPWVQGASVKAIVLSERGAFYLRCIGGARSGPPEDSGGPRRYALYLDALADPEHEEHEDMLARRGPFDPEAFSLLKVNALL
jgi:hypothetical protein